ncbi:2-oxoglutarate dehydrogenase complex dihydrolipoyllysine-residue succinyltransferase [Nitrosomonas mobilis]|uniref:Dihydrolipoyllysine-residue succinyltransferase component of 2-oxoglutarate dehydrogenase complex n=1 Tax=Nitrosomonas mobilis TaxID=51642 RepID=A0A1G5SHJ7_9PROT|nr:2-oxoglutarate dehydrogenase complex dihydrolipoyllysine-residue succinyltransferase [Nitrosomonas mobilis]SCZ86598.1 dihydrolipoyltranssuccinase [Nitrosomonas mobilis]HNO76065.1 2-oxoglutarate dehydrogenase complex dihydrolipoyllysine-residue succinyltransferase [Nitrosomonas mobilis]
MLIEVKVPILSESVADATLANWHKKKGERVERGENLIDIETDKVVMELPAPQAGILVEILKEDGATVAGEEVIARIDTTGKQAEASSETVAAKVEPAAENKAELQSVTPVADKISTDASPKLPPAAKRVAAEHNLEADEIQNIRGTGRDGRIVKQDILDYVNNKNEEKSDQQEAGSRTLTATSVGDAEPARPAVVPAAITERPEKRVPMTRLRMRIAERLVQSQATAAILTTFNEVNMQAVLDLRARYKDSFEKEHGVKLGLMSFFVKAAVAALKKYPIINASVDGNDIVYHEYFDIGIAVASPRGLVVPILRDADKLSFAEIETRIADLAKRAQEGKITLEELTGGTFSITNGGVFGSMLSTPIINPPQGAILGIHATKQRPVAENGQVVIRPMNYFALSYDHRIIDGREAVLSLAAIKEALEYPVSPLFES